MPKNIVIFSDGTGQAGGVRPDQRLSNIYKLYRATRLGPDSAIDPADQIAFYDPGLGTDDDSQGLTKALKFVSKLLASVTGRGITGNITDCYEAILDHYEPGDRIFLFGFSRGAYTARCVANVLTLCGVPSRGADGRPLPRFRSETRAIADEAVRKVYEHGAGRDRAAYHDQRIEKARRFREKYGSDDGAGAANVLPHFIGVFDTVASLGARRGVRFGLTAALLLAATLASALLALLIDRLTSAAFWQGFDPLPGSAAFHPFAWVPHVDTSTAFFAAIATLLLATLWKSAASSLKVIANYPTPRQFRFHFAKWRMKNYDRGLDTRIHYARHACAIDETRADFPRVPWGFKADHFVEEPGKPKPFVQLWFAGNHSDIGGSYPEAESRLSDISLEWMIGEATAIPGPLIVDGSKLSLFPCAGGMQHCEVDSMRDRGFRFLPEKWRPTWPEKNRLEARGAPMHPSVEERFQLPAVLKCGRMGPYRPASLRKDERFKHLY
jgi:uncharacterized protein (DUF2235 family)